MKFYKKVINLIVVKNEIEEVHFVLFRTCEMDVSEHLLMFTLKLEPSTTGFKTTIISIYMDSVTKLDNPLDTRLEFSNEHNHWNEGG